MARRMSKSLAYDFCEFVNGPGLPGTVKEFKKWASEQDADGRESSLFWNDLIMHVRDCGHSHAYYAMYQLAYAFAYAWSNVSRDFDRIGEAFTLILERTGVDESVIRKEVE